MALSQYLERSRAAEQLKREVRALAALPWGGAQSGATLVCVRHSPAVKVARVLTQLFAELPDARIERIELDARSGCSDFIGTVTVHGEEGSARVFEFVWDCRWRAAEEGWFDHWGEPDQIRAAREFDWRCFSSWVECTGIRSKPTPRIARSA
jgi:hypothetical protein